MVDVTYFAERLADAQHIPTDNELAKASAMVRLSVDLIRAVIADEADPNLRERVRHLGERVAALEGAAAAEIASPAAPPLTNREVVARPAVAVKARKPAAAAEPAEIPTWFIRLVGQLEDGDITIKVAWSHIARRMAESVAGWKQSNDDHYESLAEIEAITAERDRLAAEVQLLIDYFRSPEGDKFGREGDDKHWSTAKCAVEIMKRLTKESASDSSRARTELVKGAVLSLQADAAERIAELEAEVERLTRPVDGDPTYLACDFCGKERVVPFSDFKNERNAREAAEQRERKLREFCKTQFTPDAGTVFRSVQRLFPVTDEQLDAVLAAYEQEQAK